METIPAFYFDREALLRLAESRRESFRGASPFPHVVLDSFVPNEIMERLVREFPGPESPHWLLHGPGRTEWAREKGIDKLGLSDDTRFGPFTRHFMAQLNSATFLAFLERLTGTAGIVPDPTYSGCGLHSTGPGGRLMMHTDVNRHPQGLRFHQFLNLILYVNPDWKEEYGGHLELWNSSRQPVQRILPVANRAVLFDTGTRSLHGHPQPLTCPPGRRRNSIAVYYYLRDRPASEAYTSLQRSVRWLPTVPADHEFAATERAKALDRVAAIRGQYTSVSVGALPFEVPSELVDARRGTADLYFLEPRDVADLAAFADAHLRAAAAQFPGGSSRFFATYQPFALLGVSSGAEAANPRALTFLVDQNGEIAIATGPDSPTMLFLGYLDEMLDLLGK